MHAYSNLVGTQIINQGSSEQELKFGLWFVIDRDSEDAFIQCKRGGPVPGCSPDSKHILPLYSKRMSFWIMTWSLKYNFNFIFL